MIDISELHKFLWRKSTDGQITISQEALARELGITANNLREKIDRACGQKRFSKLETSVRGTVLRVVDPSTFVLQKKKHLDDNVIHQWLWEMSNNGQLVISQTTLVQELCLDRAYVRQEFLPKLETHKRLMKKGFTPQGVVLEIADPSTWEMPPLPRGPDLKPKRWQCVGCRKDLYHYKSGPAPKRCPDCKKKALAKSREKINRNLHTCSRCGIPNILRHKRGKVGRREIILCSRCKEIVGKHPSQQPKPPSRSTATTQQETEGIFDAWA